MLLFCSLPDAGSILKVIALQKGNFAAAEEVILEELQVFKVKKMHVYACVYVCVYV